jgi:hypothetical protein
MSILSSPTLRAGRTAAAAAAISAIIATAAASPAASSCPPEAVQPPAPAPASAPRPNLPSLGEADASLARYRAELNAFRAEHGGTRSLPDIRFFLFGMGQRPKFTYRGGKLMDARSGRVVRAWEMRRDIVLPHDYAVVLDTPAGLVRLREDGEALWIDDASGSTVVEGTRAPVNLPAFADHRYAGVLRVLHQELLVNATPAGPVPNFFVYQKPWYRDGAMMALAFRETNNLHLIRDWILGLREPYDRNNAGETEADNLGQALFLASLVGGAEHPLVPVVLAEVPRFRVGGPKGPCIRGRSDFSEHPDYQTKWLQYGLRSLGLPDPYAAPGLDDSYSALFWMDFKETHAARRDSDDREAYPYLGWAVDHFHGRKRSPIGDRDYPLTWEARASQACYENLRVLDPAYVEAKLATPHTWHAAEIFLCVLDVDARLPRPAGGS